MTKLIREPREILNKYRKTEPFLLIFARGLCLAILFAILLIYFIILVFFVATDKPFLTKVLTAQPYIPVPVLSISSNYEFSMTCEINYFDFRAPTDEDKANCNKYIVSTECKEQDPNNKFNGRCTGLFYPPIQDKFNFSLPDKRNGITFFITITDGAYDPANDNGMQVRAYDQLFVPSQLPDSTIKIISKLDPYFSEKLEDLNFHVMGYHQVNQMYISRKIKKFQFPTFFTLLGIPATYFPVPFIESNYEAVQIPGVVSNFAVTTYGSLYVGTVDWTEEVQSELRSFNVSDSIALLASFYGILVGIYVCLFGRSAILPWGACQTICCKRKSKSNLRENFPIGVPMISLVRPEQPKLDRLEALEKFIKLYLVNVADQANPELKPQGIEGGEGEGEDKDEEKKKDPNRQSRYRPLSFLSILYSAPMTRPSSRPSSRPNSKFSRPNSKYSRPHSKVSKNNEEVVLPDEATIPKPKEEFTTANVPPNENANKRHSKRLSFFLPKSESSNKGKSPLLPELNFSSNDDPLLTINVPSGSQTNNLPTESQSGTPSATPNAGVPYTKNNLPAKSQSGTPSATPNAGVPYTKNNLPTESQSGTLSAIPNAGVPYTKNNLPTESQSGTPSATPNAEVPYIKNNLPTESQSGTPSAIPNAGVPYTKNNLPTESQSGTPSAIPNAGVPYTKNNLPTESQSGTPSATPNAEVPYIKNNLPTESQSGTPSATPNAGVPYTKNNLPTESQSGIPSATPNAEVPYTTNNLPTESNSGTTSSKLPSAVSPTTNANADEQGSNLLSPTEVSRRPSSIRSEVRKSVVYVDEDGNSLTPEEAEKIRNSVVYVDEQDNPLSPDEIQNSVVEDSNLLSPTGVGRRSSSIISEVRKSVVYVDEDNNPLTPEEAEKIRNSVVYVDDDGNPLSPDEIQNSVVEDSNLLSPTEVSRRPSSIISEVRKSVVYVDEDNNPLTPEEVEKIRNSVVYVDEQDNPLSSDEIQNSVVEDSNLLSPTGFGRRSSSIKSEVRKSVVYVDEDNNPLTPEEAEKIRNSVVYVDEDGNSLTPEEAEKIRNSVVYVDEDGNSLTPEEAEKIRNSVVYVDEQDNPLSPDEIQNSVVEDSNLLSPSEVSGRPLSIRSEVRKSVVYVDEDGNPLTPEEAERIRNSVVYVDEDGNSLTPEEAERIRNSVVYVDEDGNPLSSKEAEIEELNQELYVDAGEGSSKSVKKRDLKEPVDIVIPASPTSNIPKLSTISLIKKFFGKKNKN